MARLSGEAIRVTGLSKSYADWPVLWDLELTVGWGEFLVLFGANGAGKTTLLRILSTAARPDQGNVYVAGYNARRQSESIRRHLGVVGHKHLLYEDLTAGENLLFYGRLFQISNLKERVEQVLSQVGLQGRIDHRFRNLSHGMQKRLSIARAILHQPDILLLDEPETGLDRESVSMLNNLLAQWTASGRSVVMTTHNIELGLAWADRVALLSTGKIDFQEQKDNLDPVGLKEILAPSLRVAAAGQGVHQ